MSYSTNNDLITIGPKSHRIIKRILDECDLFKKILDGSSDLSSFKSNIEKFARNILSENKELAEFVDSEFDMHIRIAGKLRWQDKAAIRLIDYFNYSGQSFEDLNRTENVSISDPFKVLWIAIKEGKGNGRPSFFEDMYYLFKQLEGKSFGKKVTIDRLNKWMDRYPAGHNSEIKKSIELNIKRIIRVIAKKIDDGVYSSKKYKYTDEKSLDEKCSTIREWWKQYDFHLQFAVRDYKLLNEMLEFSLDEDALLNLKNAHDKGIPFFITPYYISLFLVYKNMNYVGADLAVRSYALYSKKLVDEFGQIVNWEKEDKVIAGRPNAAGWLLPDGGNIHRRYPDVAILIPNTRGRACGGLCSCCQRMYGFQRGNLNFNLQNLKAGEEWNDRLNELMKYFENDSQLKDVLITGGDALMNTDGELKHILDAVYEMACRKIENNKSKKEGEKFSEIVRVRLGTKLLSYLPQRVTPELVKVLKDFKNKASKIGIKQFLIQTHFESPLEVTEIARDAVKMLIGAGWVATNQLVFTTAASRRGHSTKLRRVLNEAGVLPYYSFTVKGFMENYEHFATNSRSVQEIIEEKCFSLSKKEEIEFIGKFVDSDCNIQFINETLTNKKIPFIASDRNLMNLPGIGKSLTFRVVGITRDGRRILCFGHDNTRSHSPVLEKMENVYIVESKSIYDYLNQLEDLGESREDYESIYGYSLNYTEVVSPIFQYPGYEYEVTKKLTNFQDN